MKLIDRHQQILKAVFDNLVIKEVIEPNFIKNLQEIDPEKLVNLISELNCEANKLNCTADDLSAAVIASYCRINAETLPEEISIKNETLIKNVMLFVIKDKMKQLAVSPIIWTRYFNNTVSKLNEENRDLNLTINEFVEFIHPIYWEAITEIVF